MDVGSAASPSAYSYQASLQSTAQPAVALQALSQTYSADAASRQDGSDPLAALAGSSSLGPLVSGITAMSRAVQAGQADGSGADASGNTVQGLSDATYGGLDSNSATALLASMGGDSSGLQGFDAAVAGGATVALAAYQITQSYAPSAPAAQTSPSSTPTSTVGGAADAGGSAAVQASAPGTPGDTGGNAGLQQAMAAAVNPTSLSLLA